MSKTIDQAVARLKVDALAQGFDDIRITKADLPDIIGERLSLFLQNDHHGTMSWMEETAIRRAHPKALWPDARSVILLAMNYGPDEDPLPQLKRRDEASISVYARNRDYHDVIKGRLKTMAGRFAAKSGADVKVFIDTAPLMEKPLAAQAGLGWQGKHTNLVSRSLGSWFFIGAIVTDADLPTDQEEVDHCGSCRACLDICPTNAFPAPYQLDARRCISYLTIEHKGPIPEDLRPLMGNRIYGCDDCLAVCPWNKFASEAREAKLMARTDLKQPKLADLASLDEAAFRAKFSGSPIKRIGRSRFLRNVLTAIGNSNDPSLRVHAAQYWDDPDPVLAEAAKWACTQLDQKMRE